MAWFSNIKQEPLAPEARAGIDRLRAMAWPDFEMLMVDVFRWQGHEVERTGKGGLEGDIDLILRSSGRTGLVQCKQWKTSRMGVAVVREMWHVVAHRHADAVKIVCCGTFTDEAVAFADGKAIELIDGRRLLELVRGMQAVAPAAANEKAASAPASMGPGCPRCGAAMFQRFNLQTGKLYWGCVNYPKCKGAVQL